MKRNPLAPVLAVPTVLAVLAGPAAAIQATPPATPPPAPPEQTAGTGAGVDARVQEALKKLETGDLQGAIQGLERMRQEASASPQGLALLGGLYLEAGRAEEALAVLRPLADAPDADPAALYNAGRAAARLGQAEAAVRYFERSVAKAPSSPSARELGLIRSRQGQVVEAYRLLRPWSLANPRDTEARLTAAALSLRLERTAEAEELLAGFPADDPALRLLRAQAAIQRGDGRAALQQLEPIRDQHPPGMELELQRTRAEAHLLAGEAKAAVDLLRGQAQASPSVALVLGRAQRQAGDLDGALATLEPLANQVPEEARSLGDPRTAARISAEYGRVLLARKNASGAVTSLERATRLYPDGLEAWESLAEALTAAGRAPEAKAAIDRALQLRTARQARARAVEPAPPGTPTPPAPPAARPEESAEVKEAARLVIEGKPDKALIVARQGIGINPRDLALRALEIRALLMLERLPEALKSADAAIQAFPNNPDTLYQRGVVRMATRDFKGAEQDFRKAMEVAPNHTAAMNDLAVLLSAQGRKDEAEKLLQKALAVNPNDPQAAENLKRLREGG
ncbi:MAG TPA: tetratricopeptide repeat protein [Thermoanaerobaculia bacterium]|nr:tetratricopeptide repeat protein [Thermoanaerobaculia bacterium]